MGTPKAMLRWGDTTILGATLAVLRPLFRRVLVVTRDRAALRCLPVEVLEDEHPVRGPLAGLARGLSASKAPWCFVVGCDMPLLLPEVVQRMAGYLDGRQILAACVEGRPQPLHAYYSRSCLAQAETLLDRGISSLMALHSRCRVRSLDAKVFLDIDPELRSFKDLDTMEEYEAATKLF